MGSKYTITCECGKIYPVEVSQAGRSLNCECGRTLDIPSMIRIKKLPVWEETIEKKTAERRSAEKGAETENSEGLSLDKPAVPANPGHKEPVLRGTRLGVFIVAIILTALFSFLLFETVTHKPQPADVFLKKIDFKSGDKLIHRNSTPVTQEDFDFYLFPFEGKLYHITDDVIDHLGAYDAYIYLDNLKNGLELSENFYDNYEEILYKHKIAVVAFSILVGISVLLIAVPWFMPRRKKVVGTMRGSEWK